MKKILSLLFVSNLCFADTEVYCPVHQAYIKVSMSEADVINACGSPVSKQAAKNPTVKVPLTQLMYSMTNAYVPEGHGVGVASVYQTWSLSSDYPNQSRSKLTFNISNNKVNSIQLDGSAVNAASICNNTSVSVGDDVSSVYSACGSPTSVNQTYVNQYLGVDSTSETWIYQFNSYQAKLSLTFINGILQSIN